MLCGVRETNQPLLIPNSYIHLTLTFQTTRACGGIGSPSTNHQSSPRGRGPTSPEYGCRLTPPTDDQNCPPHLALYGKTISTRLYRPITIDIHETCLGRTRRAQILPASADPPSPYSSTAPLTCNVCSTPHSVHCVPATPQ
jgi:hypothetical protein